MIVVATHNNIKILKTFLDSLKNIDLQNEDVLIIDTNSADIEFQKEFNIIESLYPYTFIRLDYGCYDSGAYIWAYQNIPSNNYIFLQDSIEITNPDYISIIKNKLEEFDVVAGFDFPYSYDVNPNQQPWAESDIEFSDYPQQGIFGPMFSARKSILDKIPKHWLKFPTNKLLQQGMERRWSLMFHSINATKTYLEGYGDIHSSKYIKKHFYIRP
jgi:hypothetical protein